MSEHKDEFEIWAIKNGLSVGSKTGVGYTSKRTQWCYRAFLGAKGVDMSTIAKNLQQYNQKKTTYVWERILQGTKLSPQKLQNAYPDMDFCCFPLADGQHWLFLTEADMTTFVSWTHAQ